MIERVREVAIAAIAAAGSDLPVYCGFVPPSASIDDARSCLILRRTDLSEVTIEARAPECKPAGEAIDAVLAELGRRGFLRDVVTRYDAPRGRLGFAGSIAVIGL